MQIALKRIVLIKNNKPINDSFKTDSAALSETKMSIPSEGINVLIGTKIEKKSIIKIQLTPYFFKN